MNSTDIENAVRRMSDRQEIEDVLIRYAESLDGRDWEGLRKCFMPDAVADYGALSGGGGRNEGVDEIVATCSTALSGLDASQHLLGNFRIQSDHDRATASCAMHAQHFMVSPIGGNTYVVAGTYHDELIRTPDGWRITHRRLEPSWTDGNAGIIQEAVARFGNSADEPA